MTSKYGHEAMIEKVNISLNLIFKKVNAKKQYKVPTVPIKYEPRRGSYFYTAALSTCSDTESLNMLKVFDIQSYVYLKMKRSQAYP